MILQEYQKLLIALGRARGIYVYNPYQDENKNLKFHLSTTNRFGERITMPVTIHPSHWMTSDEFETILIFRALFDEFEAKRNESAPAFRDDPRLARY